MKSQLMTWLIYGLKFIAIAAGIFLCCITLLYKQEADKAQNQVERLWIKIDDLQPLAISRISAIVRVMIGAVKTFFDDLFGERLVSLQSIGVSICFAIVSGCFSLWLVLSWASNPDSLSLQYDLIITCLIGLLFGLAPFFMQRTDWVKWWFLILVIGIYHWILSPWVEMSVVLIGARVPKLWIFPLMFPLLLFSSAFFFTTFVILIRHGLANISRATSDIKVLGFLALCCSPLVSIILIWELFLVALPRLTVPAGLAADPKAIDSVSQASTFASQLNIEALFAFFIFFLVFFALFMNTFVTAVTAVIFALISLVLIINRAFWPLLNRFVYLFQDSGVIKHRKISFTIGVSLIAIGGGKIEWIETLWSKLK